MIGKMRAAMSYRLQKKKQANDRQQNYSLIYKDVKKEPLTLDDCPNFVGMILSKNKKKMKQLQD